MKKISIFLICSLLMIFGLSFSACADAVTTGGVTAVVTPRPVDSLGNEKQVEFATSAKAETTTTTETTTTKPAYNQEEMKKDLEDLGKEDMAASAVGIFAWVKGLVDWTQGIINTLGIYIKAGIDSPWGFDLNGFVDLFAPFFKTIGYGILVLLFGINLIHSAMQFELVNYKGVIKILVGLLLAKLWVDLSTDICIALIDTCTDIASSVSVTEELCNYFTVDINAVNQNGLNIDDVVIYSDFNKISGTFDYIICDDSTKYNNNAYIHILLCSAADWDMPILTNYINDVIIPNKVDVNLCFFPVTTNKFISINKQLIKSGFKAYMLEPSDNWMATNANNNNVYSNILKAYIIS